MLDGILTLNSSRHDIDSTDIKAALAAELQSSEERQTPDLKKQIERANIEKGMLLSSAQTLEAEASPVQVYKISQPI